MAPRRSTLPLSQGPGSRSNPRHFSHSGSADQPLQRVNTIGDLRSSTRAPAVVADVDGSTTPGGFLSAPENHNVSPFLSERERLAAQRQASSATVVFRPLAAVSPLSNELPHSPHKNSPAAANGHEAEIASTSSRYTTVYPAKHASMDADLPVKEPLNDGFNESSLPWYHKWLNHPKAAMLALLWLRVIVAGVIGLLVVALACVAGIAAKSSSKPGLSDYIASVPPSERQPLLERLLSQYGVSATRKPHVSVDTPEKETPDPTTESHIYPSQTFPPANTTSTSVSATLESLATLTNIPFANSTLATNTTTSESTSSSPTPSLPDMHSLGLNVTSKPFHGIAYSPFNSMEPACGFTQEDALNDIALLSQITDRIKTYGVQCNQLRYILRAIDQLHVPMKVAAGVWLNHDDAVNAAQISEMHSLLAEYPDSFFDSVFIGNEVLFRHDMSEPQLMATISETKAFLATVNRTVPVGTCEIGALVSQAILDVCDVVGINVHPFFGGVPVEMSVKWVYDFLDQQIQPRNPGHTPIAITEVGWPFTGGSFQAAFATPENYRLFMRSWLCSDPPSPNKYPWYYFEAFDEEWKHVFHSDGHQWETEWGIFDTSKKLKVSQSVLQCL